ncbi:hypothetical protein KSF_048330 [Reticulibacter mediterranei]|uniref:Uncharacterized protein n=1 Tax=Reticulibacter mediterranei TaxID=2778369 RepID=A0A8J3IQ32_9CHLR|nr:hypothetical protein [Reticulibacter mediterranei]GHO94785.1 hypothetical protein KSF_048330 [Reticulibacter mediterranei]
MKYFFWIAFAVFLAASIPHVAYFFASFEPTNGPEGVWWWVVSYAIAISIDVTVYLLSWTAFQRYRKYRTARAVWQHWLLITMCTIFSWAVNWAYAKQFHNGVMLSSAESAAPWLTNVFPFMASAFPLLGIVYTMMAETITETAAEEKKDKAVQISALSELAKQTQLPVATLRRALASGTRLSPTDVTTAVTQRPTSELTPEAIDQKSEDNRPITGHFVTLETPAHDATTDTGKNSAATTGSTAAVTSDKSGNPDKLQMTIETLKANPNTTDEALADLLSLKRPASARFWRLKAIEILSASDQAILDKTNTTSTVKENSWRSNGELANGAGPKR